MKSKFAFSLIEISVVILVVGILIAGISKGVDLYQDFKSNLVRKLTLDAKVGRMPNLVVWWESVLEKSFDKNEMVNNAQISNWYDINPQASSRYSASMSNSADKPRYKTKAINGLPAVNFSNQYLAAFDFRITGNKMTYFLVATRDARPWPAFSTPFSGASATTDTDYGNIDSFVGLEDSGSGENWSSFHNVSGMFSRVYLPALGVPFLVSSILSGNGNTAYLNGKASASVYKGANFNFNVSRLYLGARLQGGDLGLRHYGSIGELIIFNRVLTTSEHKEVLSYLSKKWDIKLNLNF